MKPNYAFMLLLLVCGPSAWGVKQYGPGVTGTEIKIGQTMPYSGPASALGAAGRAQAAYLNMINDRGGVNGRRIKLVSLDDGYNPTKTVEHVLSLPSSSFTC